MKNRRVEVRFSEKDYHFIVANRPSDFDNTSQFIRTAAMFIAKHPEVLDSSQNVNMDQSKEEIIEKVTYEIQVNRGLLEGIVRLLSKSGENDNLKKELVSDLISWYLSNSHIFKTFDDLYELIEDPFLKQVVGEAIQEMRRKGLITLKPNGDVIWHE